MILESQWEFVFEIEKKYHISMMIQEKPFKKTCIKPLKHLERKNACLILIDITINYTDANVLDSEQRGTHDSVLKLLVYNFAS